MKEELPFLNLDAATSLYLPLEPIEARAHYRFAFRLPNGDEEWLLARLCVVFTSGRNRRYAVVLQPENAEEKRLFVIYDFSYRSGSKEIESWMTPATARRFHWKLFEQAFNEKKGIYVISRFCSIKEAEITTLLEIGFYTGANVVGFFDNKGGRIQLFDEEGFRWRNAGCGNSIEEVILNFLRIKNTNFRRKIRRLWNDQNSDLQYTLSWINLSVAKRNSIALECGTGNWEGLREIAALVLQIRIAHLKQITASTYNWHFVGVGRIDVYGASELEDDDSLFLWRYALTHAFRTPNVGGEGVKNNLLPSRLTSYIIQNEQSEIEVTPPSMHEILEATLKLETWTRANFSPEHAQILMDSLKRFSEDEAQKLYDSLAESNLD